MNNDLQKPLIIQGDGSVLLDVHNPGSEKARADIGVFAELEKSPEHMHTYRISSLSLWNAASAGKTPENVLDLLKKYSRFDVPENIEYMIRDMMGRYGTLILEETDDENTLHLVVTEKVFRDQLAADKGGMKYFTRTPNGFLVDRYDRGTIKHVLVKRGLPVKDMVPLSQGDPLEITLNENSPPGAFSVRDYQAEAASALVGNNDRGSGFGTVVLPCGAGKTIVGMKVMSLLNTKTLILTPNVAAVHQWIDELVDKTNLRREDIGEYSGAVKVIKPVTIATYQVLIYRREKEGPFEHFSLFTRENWGLVIYDEVHLLPAPAFRVTAEIQAIRRLGLTATLVREDNQEDAVFSLVGPKRYDVPWKEMEQKGWIAVAVCHEIRIDLADDVKIEYATANRRAKFRIASENSYKIAVAKALLANHTDDSVIIIGQYLKQLRDIAQAVDAPLITGSMGNKKREELYKAFRNGEIKTIVVSKVANFAIDLPDASVAIQVSGSFGSRQEEAQRLGRIIRPKRKNAYFYTIVSRYTLEEDFSANRQKFLAEQGYSYTIEQWNPAELLPC